MTGDHRPGQQDPRATRQGLHVGPLPLGSPLLPRVEALYLTAFPTQERLPAHDVLHHRLQDRRVDVATAEGELLGLMVTIPQPRFGATFLEYLGVEPTRRSGGVGAALLGNLLQRVGEQEVLAELEPTTAGPDAERRERFYRRNGFEPAPWQGDYGMPGPDGSLVPLALWHRAGRPSPAEPRAFMRSIYEHSYRERGRRHLMRVLAGVRA